MGWGSIFRILDHQNLSCTSHKMHTAMSFEFLLCWNCTLESTKSLRSRYSTGQKLPSKKGVTRFPRLLDVVRLKRDRSVMRDLADAEKRGEASDHDQTRKMGYLWPGL